MVKQTAGRDALNDFAPKFAALNDDVLFGEVWSREGQLPLKLRSIVTITALISKGVMDAEYAALDAPEAENRPFSRFYFPLPQHYGII